MDTKNFEIMVSEVDISIENVYLHGEWSVETHIGQGVNCLNSGFIFSISCPLQRTYG